MSTLAIEQRLTALWETPKTLRGWFATVDHKDLGIRYHSDGVHLPHPWRPGSAIDAHSTYRADQAFLPPEMYDQIFSMHGITMIFWYASPILSGFAVYLVPLMIGARDMAFPRLNAFTYWSYLLSGIFLYVAPLIGQAPHAGWFSYMPYTDIRYSPESRDGFLCPGPDISHDLYDWWRGRTLSSQSSGCALPAWPSADAALPLQHADHLLRHTVCAAGAHGGVCLSGT